MPKPSKIEKAYLQIIRWNEDGQVNAEGDKYYVQFNPESLKVNFSNQISGQDNNGGSAIQFTSRGTTKLTFDLWFDVHGAMPEDTREYDDVRQYTADLLLFMQEINTGSGENPTPPPGCRFQWGSFLFEGVVDSLSENLEFFSEQGVPLRASLGVSLARQELPVKPRQRDAGASGTGGAGTTPQSQARAGDSVQSMSAREGAAGNWQQRARENDVDDPLRLPEGTSLPSL